MLRKANQGSWNEILLRMQYRKLAGDLQTL